MNQKIYAKEFSSWDCHHDFRVMISCVESKGNNLDELLDNTVLSLEDWDGNSILQTWTIDDLSMQDMSHLIKLYNEFLKETK